MRRSLVSAVFGSTLLAVGVAAWAITAPVSDWKIAGPFGGTARSLALDPRSPGILLAGAMNSLVFRSEDSGANWELLDFPKRNLSEVTSLLVDPQDPSHYLAGMISADGGGLFASSDKGKSWAGVGDIQEFGVRALAAAASQPARFVAGTARGVMLSDDSGKTWKRISDLQNLEMQGITAVAIDTANPDIIYAGTSHLPWRTLDGGKSWESIHTGLVDDSDVFSIYVDPANPSAVFASACSGIYRTENRGDQWSKLMGLTLSQRRTHVIRKDPAGPSTIYAGTTMGLFKSPNFGGTWKMLTNTQVNSMVFDPAHPGSMYLAMEYEGMGESNDGGEAVKMINHGFVDRAIASVTTAGDRLVALEPQLGESSGIFVSGDRGENWSQLKDVHGLNEVHLTTIAGTSSEDRILLAASPRQLYKSIDGGLIWKALPVRLVIPPPPEIEKKNVPLKTGKKQVVRKTAGRRPVEKIRNVTLNQISGLYSIKSGTKAVFFAATDLGLLQSIDAGERWTQSDIPGAAAVTALFVAPDADGRLIARGSFGLFISKDFGDHWAPLSFPLPASDVNEVAIPRSSGSALLVATRLGLYSSPDGGIKWYANLGGIPASTVSSVLYGGSDTTAYAIEYGRLYETSDAGNTWTVVPSALPTTRIRQLWMPDRASQRLYGITNDLGVLFRN
jgi:photosystem II stability/assembly factor-like uncharacterized protein